MNIKQKIQNLKNKNEKIKYSIIERETIGSIRNELETELNNMEIYKSILLEQNNECDEKIQKIQNSKKNIKICTTIFNIFMIITSLLFFINFPLSNIYFIIGSIPVMTIIYIMSIFNDVKFLKNNNMIFFKEQRQKNNKKIKGISKKINLLNKELKDVIKREFICKKRLEQYVIDIEKMFSNNKVEKYEENNKTMIKNDINIIKR